MSKVWAGLRTGTSKAKGAVTLFIYMLLTTSLLAPVRSRPCVLWVRNPQNVRTDTALCSLSRLSTKGQVEKDGTLPDPAGLKPVLKRTHPAHHPLNQVL